MKAARVLRLGSPNVITNDDLPQPEASRKSRGRYSDNKQHAAGGRQIVVAWPAYHDR
jgi:hypothetical protein